jgi:hypothetical protein
MHARLLALALVIATTLGLGQLVAARASASAGPEAAAIVVLPQSLPGYRIEDSWSHVNFGWWGAREEGALYAPLAGAADPVQLDFYRGSRTTHNGVGCFLAQGESMRSESLQAVKTRSGVVIFDIAVTQADNRVRLTAATECRVDSCTETAVRSEGLMPWQRWQIRFIPAAGAKAVVPFSVMLIRDHVADADQATTAEAQLQRQFAEVASQLDLMPAQHLAAALH